MKEHNPLTEDELRRYEHLFRSVWSEEDQLIVRLIEEVRRARGRSGALTWEDVDRLRDTADKLRESGQESAYDLDGLEDTADCIEALLRPRSPPGKSA